MRKATNKDREVTYMLPRIKEIWPEDDLELLVVFDEGKKVLYDVKEDIEELPDYSVLREVAGLFQQVQVDPSRTCVYWNDVVDLASDSIYEYGKAI